jgi:hypothetical protein
MALWNRLREELDRAGRVAQSAFDEGRLRLDLLRARQSADRFAQRLGYAVYRARLAGTELNAEEFAAHSANITAAEAEISRLQTLANEASSKRKADGGPKARPEGPDPTAGPSSEPPKADAQSTDLP